MNYIDSSKIVVFPAGERHNPGDGNGTTISEQRLASLANSLLDVGGFVVTQFEKKLSGDDKISTLTINILGRWFEIDTPDVALNLSNIGDALKIYAGITINKVDPDVRMWDDIYGNDVDDGSVYKYQGLAIFTNDEISESDIKSNNTYEYVISENIKYTCIKIAERTRSGDGTEDDPYIYSDWVIPEPNMPKILFIDGGTID